MIDASSNIKYWYFIRIMGRDPSHLALECALSTHPNYTIISEEVQEKGWDIEDIVDDIVRVILKRKKNKLNFGCIVIPEGLLAFLPTFKRIKVEMDKINAKDEAELRSQMWGWTRDKYDLLPDFIRKQLWIRDDNTNQLAFSRIETEKLIAHLVTQKIEQLRPKDEKSITRLI